MLFSLCCAGDAPAGHERSASPDQRLRAMIGGRAPTSVFFKLHAATRSANSSRSSIDRAAAAADPSSRGCPAHRCDRRCPSPRSRRQESSVLILAELDARPSLGWPASSVSSSANGVRRARQQEIFVGGRCAQPGAGKPTSCDPTRPSTASLAGVALSTKALIVVRASRTAGIAIGVLLLCSAIQPPGA